ncbi:MAG TPA: SRPBCC family protein [Candidatus Acidoferrum sp.]|jgi:activator of HSP90 ATPase
MNTTNYPARPARLSNGYSRRQLLIGSAAAIGGALALTAPGAWSLSDDGVSRNAEAIHQEPTFRASPKQIYEALTDAAQFQKMTLGSEAMKIMDLKSKPAEISRELGGAFSLFGGYIIGRQLELVLNQRIVQAWRVGSWPAGIFSIVRFELAAQGDNTKLIFDHAGFPAGDAEHLATGWQINYWQPLTKLLAAQA